MLNKILIAILGLLIGALIYFYTLSHYLDKEIVKSKKEVKTIGFKRENRVKKEVADEKIDDIFDSNITVIDGNYSM